MFVIFRSVHTGAQRYTWRIKTVWFFFLSVYEQRVQSARLPALRAPMWPHFFFFLRPPLSSGPMRTGSIWSSQERPCLGDIAHCVSLSPQPAELRSSISAFSPALPVESGRRSITCTGVRPAVTPLTEDTSADTLTVSTRCWGRFHLSPLLLEFTHLGARASS